MTDFCHVSPTDYLRPLNIKEYKSHLLLAHLVESDGNYTATYKTAKDSNKTYILDNSAFELYRAGLLMFDATKLIKLGKAVCADYIVLPDYPGESGVKTIEAAQVWAPQFKAAGFRTFFVPQSNIGDLEDYISAFAWAASSPLVDYIGMSILGIPNAYGVDGNDIQRYISRYYMFKTLQERKLIQLAKSNGKKIHCLGMTDGPNEIELLKQWIKGEVIDTWDSSAAVWAGIEGFKYDSSPTGLINGKVKSHVDFSRELEEDKLPLIKANMRYIDNMIYSFS